MSGLFGFRLSDNHINTIMAWRAKIVPDIHAFRHQKYADQPWMLEMLGDQIWMSDGGEHIAQISPFDETEWQLQLGLLRDVYPPLSIDLFGDIEVITAYPPISPPSQTDKEFNRVYGRMKVMAIGRGYYDHLLQLGWTIENARQYEYRLFPSGLDTHANIRCVGDKDWITLDDPYFRP